MACLTSKQVFDKPVWRTLLTGIETNAEKRQLTDILLGGAQYPVGEVTYDFTGTV